MARISLQEQYENKDVIQQIYSLKDDVNRVSETTENIKDDVNAVSRTAEEAKTLAQQTANKAEEIETLAQQTANKAEEIETLAQQASDTADTAVTTIQGTVTSGAIVADTVSAKLKLNKVSGGSEDSVIPIASASQTGMMNAQTYAGITNLNARLSALEGKNTNVYVTFPNDEPDQSIITSTFQTKAGRPPVAGDYAVDIAKNLTYGYDGSVWNKVDTDITIPQFSLDTHGLIKGNDEDGTVFAEADGTGSVKGWDALKQSVQNNSTAIEQNSTATQTALNANAAEIIGLKARVAVVENGKIDKNQGSENSGLTFKVGDNGNVELVPFPECEIDYDDVFDTLRVKPSTPTFTPYNCQLTVMFTRGSIGKTIGIGGKYYNTSGEYISVRSVGYKFDVDVSILNDLDTNLKDGAYYIYLNSYYTEVYGANPGPAYVTPITQSHKIRCDVIAGKIKNISSRIVPI